MTAGKVAKRIASALAVVVLAGLVPAGCGGGSGKPEALAGRGGPVVDRAAPHRRPRASAAVARLQRALARSLRAAGTSTGASVLDLTAGTQLFSVRAGVRRPPASVEKLYTTFALLRRLGAQAQLHTRVLATGHLGRGGIWHGNLYLRGGGDPTFGDRAFQRVWYLGYGASVTDLAGQLAGTGIRRVSGSVIADASLFDAGRGGPASGLAADIPDFGGQLSALTFDHGTTQGLLSPGAFAARQLVRTMRAMGIRARAAPGTAQAPGGAQRLAEVSSPPLPVLLDLMNVPSDDLFAEMLTKQLGARFYGDGTIAAGAGAIEDQVTQLGLHPRIVDGSGLSRRDASSPAQVVTLLQATWRTPTGRTLAASLPVVGQTGTVRRIGVGTAAQGRCVAKTGTLDAVTNLAGLCHSRGGHTIAFAVFIDGPSNGVALPWLSRAVAAIARYRP
ncbi:MAG: D-alanyl-D-alanine carboxypeptidase/D-alanyl-D-alanine-endopeptidase [Actinomycetota bacterium]|nr:D-alanyl-D-alanine carboxypeptidase/D-alanyl-D-alanine-endopeptidase [Actinomycetota bacterium]